MIVAWSIQGPETECCTRKVAKLSNSWFDCLTVCCLVSTHFMCDTLSTCPEYSTIQNVPNIAKPNTSCNTGKKSKNYHA